MCCWSQLGAGSSPKCGACGPECAAFRSQCAAGRGLSLGCAAEQFVVIGVTVPVTVWVLLGSTFPSDSESVAQDRLPTRLLIVEGGDSDSVGWVLPLEDFFLSWWRLITFSQSESSSFWVLGLGLRLGWSGFGFLEAIFGATSQAEFLQ